MKLDLEELEEFVEELEFEGERHFIRNLEESGYTYEEATDVLQQVEEYRNYHKEEV